MLSASAIESQVSVDCTVYSTLVHVAFAAEAVEVAVMEVGTGVV
jgi:hypothetical protein